MSYDANAYTAYRAGECQYDELLLVIPKINVNNFGTINTYDFD